MSPKTWLFHPPTKSLSLLLATVERALVGHLVNRDPISSEMLNMRQQLECLQIELCARGGGASSKKFQALKDRIAWLEATNEDLCCELCGYRSRSTVIDQCGTDAKIGDIVSVKSEGLKTGLQSMDSPNYQMGENGYHKRFCIQSC